MIIDTMLNNVYEKDYYKEYYMSNTINGFIDQTFSPEFLLDELQRVTRENEDKGRLLNSIQNLIYTLQDVLETEPVDVDEAKQKIDFAYEYLGMIGALSLKVQQK